MGRLWDVSTALAVLQRNGITGSGNRLVINRAPGLKVLGVIDFLKRHDFTFKRAYETPGNKRQKQTHGQVDPGRLNKRREASRVEARRAGRREGEFVPGDQGRKVALRR